MGESATQPYLSQVECVVFVCDSKVKGMYLPIFAIDLYDTLSSYELCLCPLILRNHIEFTLLEILTIFGIVVLL